MAEQTNTTDFRTLMRRQPAPGNHPLLVNSHFDRVDVGPFSLSIQASDTHYSTPRDRFPSANDYLAFEVAIFEGKAWIAPQNDPRFAGLACLDRFESGGFPVGGYIPTHEVQALYDRCVSLAEAKAVRP